LPYSTAADGYQNVPNEFTVDDLTNPEISKFSSVTNFYATETYESKFTTSNIKN
jgi:hypothetical protein